jgi:superfamily II DNA or RNA helicase
MSDYVDIHHYIYIMKNDNWLINGEYKFGSTQNPCNRINDSIEQHSERSEYTHIFKIKKTDKYRLYDEPDKIFSIFTKQLNLDKKDKYPLLFELKTHLIKSKTKITNEFVKLSGVEIIEKIINNEFPRLGLELVYKYTKDEIDEINQSSKENYDNTQKTDTIDWANFWQEQTNNLPKLLKGYQPDAYDKMKNIVNNMYNETFDYTIRLYIMCRCGKTELFKKFAYDYQDKFSHIIYVCPRLTLIGDMIARWCEMIPDFIIVEISSSESLYNITDTEFDENIGKNKKMLIFVCDKSFTRLTPLLKSTTNKLFIFDEAHYLVTKQTDKHPLKLLEKNNGNCVKIFSTATPINGNYLFNKDFIFMNDPEYFGNSSNIINYNDIEDAIKNKFMTPASLIVGAYENDEKDSDPDNVIKNKSIQMLESLLTDESLDYRPRKILMYANTISKIKSIFKSLQESTKSIFQNIDLFMVTSDLNPKDNIDNIKKFKESSKIAILINCKMVTDGINIKELDTVVFVDPRYNKSDIIQIISRPRSYRDDIPNKMAYLLIPHEFSSSDDSECNNKFKTAMTIIKELHINNDPAFVKFVTDIKHRNRKNNQVQSKFGNIIIDEKIKNKIITLTKDTLIKQYVSLSDAIIKTLTDGIPRSASQIWKSITIHNLWSSYAEKNPEASCSANCGTLFKKNKIQRQRYKIPNCNNPVFMYYIIKKHKMHISTKTFVSRLLNLKIKHSDDYYDKIRGLYTEIYVIDPIKHYSGFNWNMLIQNTETPYDEIDLRKVIDKILAISEHKSYIEELSTPIKKLEYLNSIDKLIPINASEYYGTELYGIHNIFAMRMHSRTRR